ncbi:MAG: alpha/beta hydrolase [Frankiaceae bacterium]|nr:alpha/beta hydrolase [Frankiaceae bacterium]
MTPHLLSTTRGPVEYAESGAGPAVLVVHGTPGDWQQARALADDLAGSHRVLLPSRPGYGRTPLSTGRSPQEQAQAHVALLDALGIDRAAVVGISGGGPSSRAVAADHRDRCTALVLCCAVAEHLVTVPTATRLLGSVPALWEVGAKVASARMGRRLRDRQAALAQALAGLGPAEIAIASGDPLVEADLLAFAHARRRSMTSVAGLRNDFRWFREITSADPWPPGPDVRTLILHGDADDVVPVSHAQYYRESIPGAILEVLPGVGHGFVLSLRRQTSARLAAFLEES